MMADAMSDTPTPTPRTPRQCWDELREQVALSTRLLVGFSGGADSALLAYAAHDVLGEAAVAATAVSASLPAAERSGAADFCRKLGIAHVEVCTDELGRPEYARNGADRCFHCKSALFDALEPLARMSGADVAVGTNLDDLGSRYRPGQAAATQRGVRRPLADAGLTKADVRAVSALLDLPSADKPAAACLASRVAYGDRVTEAVLARIEAAEVALHGLGFVASRVRSHADGDGRSGRGARCRPAAPARPPRRGDRWGQGCRFHVLLPRPRRLPVGQHERPAHHRPRHGLVSDPHRTDDLGFAVVDLDRERRQGLPEIVYGPGKTADEIVAIVTSLLTHCAGPVLVSRLEPEAAADVTARVPDAVYDAGARVLAWRASPAGDVRLAVVSAGTSDGPVAREAAGVARAIGLPVDEYADLGVAGIHRLLDRADDIAGADLVIVVAGMEGALASVVGGLVPVPVIAVPTSTGYGAALEGVTALLAMLSSCAAGVTVVGIDNGLGAALAAHRLAASLHRAAERSP